MALGKLIVIEGIDGCGKTTLVRHLARELRPRFDVVETREPSDGEVGARLRALSESGRGALSPLEEFRLFNEDREDHVARTVRPALARGAVVVQDRSYHSTIAYQGERGLDRAWLWTACERLAPVPDLLLVIDLHEDVALARIRSSRPGAPTTFESRTTLARVRAVYASFPGAVILDGMSPPRELAGAALRFVLETLNR